MPRKAQPSVEPDRRRNMVNIWLGKQLGPELEDLAAREQHLAGHMTTKTDLARELLLWALERYREAGSLARLKARTREDAARQTGIESEVYARRGKHRRKVNP